MCRASKNRRALFHENLVAAKTFDEAKPFALQGVGFYLYFIGKFQKAAERAKHALRHSLKQNSPYIRFLATDLLGHCLVQLGRRAEGLRLLKNARDLALKADNANFAAAFASAALIYEAEAGWRPHRFVSELATAR